MHTAPPIPTSTGSNDTARPAPGTLADVVGWIDAAAALAVRERRDFRGAVRTVCAILGSEPWALPADAAEIGRRLAAIPKPSRGRADKTVANVRWRLGRVIALANGTGVPPQRGLAISPAWAALSERLASQRLRSGLSRLIRAASASGVEPEQVSDTLLESIAQHVAAGSGDARARAFQAMAANCWNEAASAVAGWPAIRLTPPPQQAIRPKRLPLEAFPVSFQRDVDNYLAWAAGSGRLARGGASRGLSPASVRLRREHLRLAASALARRLGYARRVIDLATLVEPVNFKLALTEYLETGAGSGTSAFVRGLAGTLFGVARQWVKAPASKLDALGQFKRRLGSGAPGLAERSRRAIEPFADPVMLGQLLALPERLLAQSAGGASLQPRAVRRAQVGVAIALLLVVPLRLRQLVTLRLGHELRCASGTQAGTPGPLSIVAGAVGAAAATGIPGHPIGGRAGQVLDEYLVHCHRALLPNPDGWLFVCPDGSRVAEAALRHGIAAETRRTIGVALTPGRFRHLAAALVLRERPGDLDLVRSLLGHHDPRTTSRLYAGIGARGAASAYAAVLDRSANRT